MANALQGTATFHYPDEDGQEYRLVLNNRVLMEAEDVLGYSALDAAEEAKQAMAMGRNPMLRTVIALFYGALVQNHREISEDAAIDMFLSDNPAAQNAFKAVLVGTDAPSAGKAVGNGQAKPQGQRSGTGSASSKAGVKRASRKKSSS